MIVNDESEEIFVCFKVISWYLLRFESSSSEMHIEIKFVHSLFRK
jgi:hypothetical protein